MATILLIDDDEQVRLLCQTALEARGHSVLTAESGRHGLRVSERQEVDLALVDLFLPDMDGVDVIELLHRTRPACKIIAMSGGSWSGTALDTATQLGANVMLKKPFSLQELLDAVASQLN